MAKLDVPTTEADLGAIDHELLDLLAEGRITAPFASEHIDYSTQYIRDHLRALVRAGYVHKVHQGLYELDRDPRTES